MTAVCNVGKEHIIVEGDYKLTVWTLTNKSDGELYDFTGVTKIWFTVKKNETDSDANAIIKLNTADNPTQVEYDAPDPGAGKVRVKLENADTVGLAVHGSMHYDIQVLKNGKPQTPVIGAWPAFRHEITEATS